MVPGDVSKGPWGIPAKKIFKLRGHLIIALSEHLKIHEFQECLNKVFLYAFAFWCVEMYCLGCVNFNTNTDAHEDPNITENVASWSACSDLCRARTDVDCQFWTWVDENGGEYALQCITMTNKPETYSQNNIVSGERECGGSASSQISSYSSLAMNPLPSLSTFSKNEK